MVFWPLRSPLEIGFYLQKNNKHILLNVPAIMERLSPGQENTLAVPVPIETWIGAWVEPADLK